MSKKKYTVSVSGFIHSEHFKLGEALEGARTLAREYGQSADVWMKAATRGGWVASVDTDGQIQYGVRS